MTNLEPEDVTFVHTMIAAQPPVIMGTIEECEKLRAELKDALKIIEHQRTLMSEAHADRKLVRLQWSKSNELREQEDKARWASSCAKADEIKSLTQENVALKNERVASARRIAHMEEQLKKPLDELWETQRKLAQKVVDMRLLQDEITQLKAQLAAK